MNPRLLTFSALLAACACSSSWAQTDTVKKTQPKSLIKPISFSPDDLLQQQPSMNEDLNLLFKREKNPNKTSALSVSGGLEAQIFNHNNHSIDKKDERGLSLSTVELTAETQPTRWLTGFASVDYDSQPITAEQRKISGKTTISRGFVTLGNLHNSPFYVTAGKTDVPFGQGSSALISPPKTLTLSRLIEPGIIAGYQRGFINTQFFVYQNQQHKTHQGARISYHKDTPVMDIAVSASYLSDLSDSQGMQETGAEGNYFNGFQSLNRHLIHRVGGADITGTITRGPISFNTELTRALKSFSPQDLSSNQHGAKPASLQLEADYTGQYKQHPWLLGVRYGKTWDALGLNLPAHSLGLVASTSYWKNSKQIIEVSQNYDYKAGSSANGGGASHTPITGTGKHFLSLTVQGGLYF